MKTTPTASNDETAGASSKPPPRQAVGVRLSQEEKKILEDLAPDTSHGDAVRQLIHQFDRLRRPPGNQEEAQARIHALIAQIDDDAPRSKVVEDIIREAEAILASAVQKPADPHALLSYEAKLVDRGFDLLDRLMQAAFVEQAPALDPQVVRERFKRSRALIVSAIAQVSASQPPRALPAQSGKEPV